MKPFKPPIPIVTNVLVGLCVAVQAAVIVLGPRFGEALVFAWGLIPLRITAVLHGIVPPLPALLTLATSLFLHGGIVHLLLNMVFLAWVGRYVEWVVGRWGMLLLFVGGGIAGGLLQIASDLASPAPVVGASGAIAAIFGAYAVLFGRSRASERRILGIAISSEAMTALWFAAVWIGLQLLTGLALGAGSGLGHIAIWTHIGGFITGLILVRPWMRGPRVEL